MLLNCLDYTLGGHGKELLPSRGVRAARSALPMRRSKPGPGRAPNLLVWRVALLLLPLPAQGRATLGATRLRGGLTPRQRSLIADWTQHRTTVARQACRCGSASACTSQKRTVRLISPCCLAIAALRVRGRLVQTGHRVAGWCAAGQRVHGPADPAGSDSRQDSQSRHRVAGGAGSAGSEAFELRDGVQLEASPAGRGRGRWSGRSGRTPPPVVTATAAGWVGYGSVLRSSTAFRPVGREVSSGEQRSGALHGLALTLLRRGALLVGENGVG